MHVLTKRRDFLAAARARKWAQPGLVLQARRRKPDEISEVDVRIGFTVTKKVGKAHDRNRAKRRLREIAREVLSVQARPGYDYVLIGRGDTLTRPFLKLRDDLCFALEKVHEAKRRRGPKKRPSSNTHSEGRSS